MKLKKRKKLYSKGKLHTIIMIPLINKRWYYYAQTMAEKNAVEIAKRDALDLISICPTHVMGPLSKSPTNANVAYRIFGGQMKGNYWPIVDVRNVANALLLAYENPIAKGRYICTSHTITEKDLREKMKILNPNLNLPPTMCVEDDDIYEEVNNYVDEEDVKRRLSSMKLQIDLDWRFKLYTCYTFF